MKTSKNRPVSLRQGLEKNSSFTQGEVGGKMESSFFVDKRMKRTII